MSDMISRSALIETIKQHMKLHEKDAEERGECSDCSRRKLYQKRYEDGLNANKWIPVSEQLPTFGEKVLCSLNPDNPTIIHLVIISVRNTEKYWYDGTIVAWQPLPEPYREKVEE